MCPEVTYLIYRLYLNKTKAKIPPSNKQECKNVSFFKTLSFRSRQKQLECLAWSPSPAYVLFTHWDKFDKISSCTTWRKLMGEQDSPESPGFPEEWLGLAMGFLGQGPCTPQTWPHVALPLQVMTAGPRPGFEKGFCRPHFHIALLCSSYHLWRLSLAGALLALNPLCSSPKCSLRELSCGMGTPMGVAKCAEMPGLPVEGRMSPSCSGCALKPLGTFRTTWMQMSPWASGCSAWTTLTMVSKPDGHQDSPADETDGL